MNQQGQQHPLYSGDRNHLDRLLGIASPKDENLVDLARLLIRYRDFPGVEDLKTDITKIMKLWGLSQDTLYQKTKNIWAKGFRPGENLEEGIGSGFDTSDKTTN